MNCPSEEHLLEYADGQARVDDSHRIEAHLARCGPCSRALADLKELMNGVAADSDSYRSAQRRARIMTAVAMEREAAAQRETQPARLHLLWRDLWKGLTAAAAVAVLALFFITPGEDTGFGVRGDAAQPDRWVGVRALQVLPGDPQPKEIATDLPHDADLLFMYSNRTEQPLRWLVILARDAAGEIHWLQPPRPASADDAPTALPIRGTPADETWTGIPELIRMRPPLGPLIIGAVFSKDPMPVDIAEAWMKETDATTRAKAPQPETVSQVISLRVVAARAPTASE